LATSYEEKSIPVEQLLLDPNNFRFQDESDYVRADSERFAEPSVQERATKRIRSEGLTELKASIISNGFLAVERLVVRKYQKIGDDKWLYLVLEGNRRLASLKWIAEDHKAGVTIPHDVMNVLAAIPVIVIESDDGEVTYLSIMGIRHVGGIKQWGGYQRAKLVGDLRDKHGLDSSDIADRLGMTKHEVNRRYRALKALQQMEEDEDFGDYASSAMYPLFHEAVSLPVVRIWLGWNDTESKFEENEDLRQFYQLITPLHADGDEDVSDGDPKIISYSQIRDLRDILNNAEAKKVLLDHNRTFGDALGMAKADELSSSWRTEVAEALSALGSIGVLDLEKLKGEDLDLIRNVQILSQKMLDTYAKLTS
jgi:ParB-like nuclease domain